MPDQVNPQDMKDVRGTPWRPMIVKKHPREKMSAYIARAKERGVLRKCAQCGFRRAFDKVNCPLCGDAEFYQVQKEKEDTSKDEPKAHEPMPESEKPTYDPDAQPQPKEDGGGAYRFEPNPDFNPQDETQENVEPTPVRRPLAEHSVDELRGIAKERGVNVGNMRNKDKIVEKLETQLEG